MALKMHNIDGIDYAQCIVLLLPCKNESDLMIRHSLIHKNNQGLYYKEEHYDLAHEYQNIYILNNESPKENDWVLDPDGKVRQVIKIENDGRLSLDGLKHLTIMPSTCMKIIATTDDSLTREIDCPDGIEGCEVLHLERLPRICDKFIRHYVDEYNKGNVLRSVFVEYDYYPQSGCEQMGGWIRKLIINPEEHTISTLILPVKTTWNRREVMDLLNKYKNDYEVDWRKIQSFKNIISHEDWLNENL